MDRLPLDATADDVARFARAWVCLAAREGFDAAMSQIEPGHGGALDAASLRAMTENHFDDGQSCTLTDPDEVDDLRVDVYPYKDASGFAVDHDLALNHRRSDFTAQFNFRKAPDGYRVFLDDIHIL